MAVLVGHQQQGGVAPGLNAQPSPRLVEVAVDGVLRNAEAAADLFRLEMLGDQTQALTLPWREFFDRGKIVKRPHNGEVNPPLRFRPCLSCKTDGWIDESPQVEADPFTRLWKADSEASGSPNIEILTDFRTTSGAIWLKRVAKRGRGPPSGRRGRRNDSR